MAQNVLPYNQVGMSWRSICQMHKILKTSITYFLNNIFITSFNLYACDVLEKNNDWYPEEGGLVPQFNPIT